MKKTSIGVVTIIGAAVGVGGYYAANNYMINQAQTEYSTRVKQELANFESPYVQIQQLSSQIESGSIREEYAIYPLENGQRQDVAPLYVTHQAQISSFASQIEGELSIVKDKGLAAEFIAEITTFNEDIHYTYQPLSDQAEVKADFTLGAITDGRDSFKAGTVSITAKGNMDASSASISLPSMQFSDSYSKFDLKSVTFDVDSKGLTEQTVKFALASLKMDNLNTDESVSVNDVKWNVSAIAGENASISADIGVADLKLNTQAYDLPSLNLAFNLEVDQFDSTPLEQIAELSVNDYIDFETQQQIDALAAQVVANGVNVSNLSLKLNDSSLVGYMTLPPVEQANLEDYEIINQAVTNFDAKFDVVIGQLIAQNLPDLQPMLMMFFEAQDNGEFKATIEKPAKQQTLTINGQPLM